MAKDYSRPMGLTGNPGLSVGALINPNTTSSAHIPQIESSRSEGFGSGSPGIIRQAGCPSDLSQRYCRFHKFFVCGAQEGWRKSPSCKFETSQPISGVRTLQNGRYSHVERPPKTGRLSGQDRSQGCIFDHSNLERSSKVFTFSMERNVARVCLPSVWASHSTQGFHQTYETCSSHVETEGSAPNYIFRRHVNHGRVNQPGTSPCSISSESTGKSGFCCQLSQISAHSKPANRVPGLSGRFSNFVTSAARRKVAQDTETVPTVAKCRRDINTRIIQIPGPPNFFNSSSFPSPSALQTSAEIEKSQPKHPTVLRCNNSSRLSSEGRTSLVARPSPSVEWQSSVPKVCRPSNRNRCLTQGLGGLLRRSKYRGPMVFKRTETSHKFFRTPSRILCNQNLLQEQGSSTCQTADGQCVSSSLHQQNGGHPFPNSSQFGYRPLELVPRPQNTGVGRTPTRSSELEGRQRISSDNRLQRLEIESSIFRNPCSEMGTFASRSLCLPTNFPVTTVCELETRSSCHCHRCFLNELGGHQRLCFSSICPHRTLFATGNDAECRPFSVSSSSMASTALVSSSSTLSSRQASVTSSHTRAFNERQSSTPFDQSSTGWVGAISQRYQTSGISTETRDILLAAWRRNTSSAYSCAWNKWVSWCCQRQINPISASLTSVLEFLKDQFKGGKAYRTLNVYRSALSAVLPLVDSFRVGAHPLVTQLLKGISQLRPPVPKYSYTWNVSEVLDFIKSLGKNEKLNLKLLSFKLAMLLSLTAPDRSSDLVKRDLRYRTFHPEGVSFNLHGLSKTSRPGDPPKVSFHAAFPSDVDLCPVECLKCYEALTSAFRPKDPSLPNQLFLSYIRPHSPVTSSSVARWIKSILELSGIDISIFTAHSVRGAATSEALNKGISIPDILKMASWSNESTFQRFYYRPQFNSSPGKAVLSVRE